MEYFEMLEVADQSALIMAIFAYQRDGTEPVGLTSAANMAFRFIRDQLDRDREKYERMCERSRTNGTHGGRPKKTESVFEKPKKPDNDTDNETEIDTDTVTDTDTEGLTAEGGVGPTPSGTVGVPRGGKEKKRRKKGASQQQSQGSFDTDEFFNAALARSYRITGGG